LVRAVQAHFSSAENLQDEVLRDTIWVDGVTADTVSTRIMIAAARHYSVKDIQQRPAVLVVPGMVQATRVGIQDKMPAGLNIPREFAGNSYTKKLVGGHLVRCVARGEMAAARLGEEVFFRLLMYSPLLLEDMRVSDLQVSGMSEPKEIDEDSQCYGVDIGIAWALMYEWTLSQVSPVLEKVTF
jgi:hypothetical protein